MKKGIQRQIEKTQKAIKVAKEVRKKEGFAGSSSARALTFLVLENQVLIMKEISEKKKEKIPTLAELRKKYSKKNKPTPRKNNEVRGAVIYPDPDGE